MMNDEMPNKPFKPRPKMPNSQRAKQFLPFAALKGYEEALRKKELELEKKRSESEKGEKIID